MIKKILCIGDSLTAGYSFFGSQFFPYGDFLENTFHGKFEVDHVGYSGWKTDKMLYTAHKPFVHDVCDRKWPGLDSQLSTHHYEYIFLLAGTNDLSDTPPSETILNIRKLLQLCFSHTNYVGLLTIPTMGAEEQYVPIRNARSEINAAIRSIASGCDEKVFVVDTANALPLERGNAEVMALWDRDELHLSEKGYQRIAATVAAAILKWEAKVASKNT